MGILNALLTFDENLRRREAAFQDEIAAGRRADDLTRRIGAIGAALGGQPGPFAPDMMNPETGLSLPLEDQNMGRQAETLARLGQIPETAGLVAPAIVGAQPGTIAANERAAKDANIARQRDALKFQQDTEQRELGILTAQEGLTDSRIKRAEEARQRNIDRAIAGTAQHIANLAYQAQTGQQPAVGFRAAQNPSTGMLEQIPLEGTPAWNDARDIVQAKERIVRNVQTFKALFDEYGLETLGGEAAQKMVQTRAAVIADVFLLRNMGAPQSFEMENVESQLPDPTSFMRRLTQVTIALGLGGLAAPLVAQKVNEAMVAGYDQLLELARRDMHQAHQNAWYVPPTPGINP